MMARTLNDTRAMNKVGSLGFFVLTACFHPYVASDVPCSPNETCPDLQLCDLSRSPPVCVDNLHTIDASVPNTLDIDGAPDHPVDAPSALGRWGPPVMWVITPALGNDDPTLTGDMLELYFNHTKDIYVARRASRGDAWSAATIDTELSTLSLESTPEVSLDGLTIYFSSDRGGNVDVWAATRASRNDRWSTPVLVPALNTPGIDRCATPTRDVIVMSSNRIANNVDIFMSSKRAEGTWTPPTAIVGLNTAAQDSAPFLSDDRLTLYFFSDRDGDSKLYYSQRSDPTGGFSTVTPINELNTEANETDPWVSPDQRHLIFARDDVLYESRR